MSYVVLLHSNSHFNHLYTNFTHLSFQSDFWGFHLKYVWGCLSIFLLICSLQIMITAASTMAHLCSYNVQIIWEILNSITAVTIAKPTGKATISRCYFDATSGGSKYLKRWLIFLSAEFWYNKKTLPAKRQILFDCAKRQMIVKSIVSYKLVPIF